MQSVSNSFNSLDRNLLNRKAEVQIITTNLNKKEISVKYKTADNEWTTCSLDELKSPSLKNKIKAAYGLDANSKAEENPSRSIQTFINTNLDTITQDLKLQVKSRTIHKDPATDAIRIRKELTKTNLPQDFSSIAALPIYVSLKNKLREDPTFLKTMIKGQPITYTDPALPGSYLEITLLASGANGSAYNIKNEHGQELVIKQANHPRHKAQDIKIESDRMLEAQKKLGYTINEAILPNAEDKLKAKDFGFMLMYKFDSNLAATIKNSKKLKQLPTSEQQQNMNFWLDIANQTRSINRDGIGHRDLKPDNVFIKGKHAYIADLGFAITLGEGITRKIDKLVPAGTRLYMAPELVTQLSNNKNEPYSVAATDSYSLGIMLYELLTAKHPVLSYCDPQNKEELYAWIIENKDKNASFITFNQPTDQHLTPEIKTLIKALTHPNPELRLKTTDARFQSQVAQALRSLA